MSRASSIIITIIMFLIILVLCFFGYIVWQEVTIQNSTIPDVQTVVSDVQTDNHTVDENINTPQIVENPLDKFTSPGTTQVNYQNLTLDNFFYDQLDEYSQLIYKALESNKENMKSGTYRIDLGDSFSDLLNTEGGQDTLNADYQSAIEAYLYDNPDVFYLEPTKLYLNIESTTRGSSTTHNAFIDNGTQVNYLADEYPSESAVNNAIAQIENVKNEILSNRTGNRYQDIKMVHDYLIESITYDTSISQPSIYDIYGALVRKECVCEGYARAFKYLMDELEIPCVIIIGTATNTQGETESHAWNYVQLGNSWYAIDTTWDDPISLTGGLISTSSKYRYFLKGSAEISKDHFANGQFSDGGKIFQYPQLSISDYEN